MCLFKIKMENYPSEFSSQTKKYIKKLDSGTKKRIKNKTSKHDK